MLARNLDRRILTVPDGRAHAESADQKRAIRELLTDD